MAVNPAGPWLGPLSVWGPLTLRAAASLVQPLRSAPNSHDSLPTQQSRQDAGWPWCGGMGMETPRVIGKSESPAGRGVTAGQEGPGRLCNCPPASTQVPAGHSCAHTRASALRPHLREGSAKHTTVSPGWSRGCARTHTPTRVHMPTQTHTPALAHAHTHTYHTQTQNLFCKTVTHESPKHTFFFQINGSPARGLSVRAGARAAGPSGYSCGPPCPELTPGHPCPLPWASEQGKGGTPYGLATLPLL